MRLVRGEIVETAEIATICGVAAGSVPAPQRSKIMSYNPALRGDPSVGPFPYEEIPRQLSENATLQYRARVNAMGARLVKQWNSQIQSEWLARHYLASKFMMAAGLMLASAEYSEQRRLHVPIPYLLYYGLFQSCRAFVLTVPFIEWRDASLLGIGHERVRNIAVDEVRQLDAGVAQRLDDILVAARTRREFFSYSFPANGPGSLAGVKEVRLSDTTALARLLCELAQLNSESLEAALEKLDKTFPYDLDCVSLIGVYKTIDGFEVFDDEDLYRLGQLFRRESRPRNIWSQTREGFIEDFAAGWGAGDTSDDDFDPDRAVGFVFPF